MILAIDPGCTESAFALISNDLSINEMGKVDNTKLLESIMYDCITEFISPFDENFHIAIEMVASYGMAVGKEVFDTVFWIGRFYQQAEKFGFTPKLIYRKDEKINLCGTMKAKDSNVIQALVDRFAYNVPNKGKGSKKNPGWFYGFAADIWQAYAVGITYHDMYLNKLV